MKLPGNVVRVCDKSECVYCGPVLYGHAGRKHERRLCVDCIATAERQQAAETDREIEAEAVAEVWRNAARIRGQSVQPLPDDSPATEKAARAACGDDVRSMTGTGTRQYFYGHVGRAPVLRQV